MWFTAVVFLAIFFSSISFHSTTANSECVWATGRLVCHSDQKKVVGAIVELYDLDSPQNLKIKNPVDPDDKAGFSVVEGEDGVFSLEGCASDVDWIPGIKNRPEFYLRVHHSCRKESGEYKTILPVFKVYTPQTYDYHIEHPIYLD